MVTAGNASQISDGAAALLVTTSEGAAGARADARWPASTPWRWPADDPVHHAHRSHPRHREGAAAGGPRPRRHRRVRGQRGVRLGAAGVAAPRPAPTRPAEPATAGRSRSGHPLGASGARLMTTLLHQMRAPASATACRRCARAAAWPTRRCWNGGEQWAGSRDHVVPGPRHSPPAVVPSALPQQGRDRLTAVGLSPVHRGHGESCRTSGTECGTSRPMALTCHR